MSHDDQGQAGTSGRRVLIASLVLKGQAQARSPEASGKGFHIGATRPRPAGRQDGGHRRAHDGVTTRAFGRRRPPFVRMTCTSCPLQIGRCGIPSRLIFGERTRASINRASHHHRRHPISYHLVSPWIGAIASVATHKLAKHKSTSLQEVVLPL